MSTDDRPDDQPHRTEDTTPDQSAMEDTMSTEDTTSPAPTPGPAPAAGPPPTHDQAPEPAPPAGLRVGTVVWGLIVALVGIGLLALAAGAVFDVELAVIGLVALAGVALLVGSVVTGARRRGR